MCVTNFVKRTPPKPVAVQANPAALSTTPSLISQRLHGSLLPMLVTNAPVAKPANPAAVNNNVFASTFAHHGISPMAIGNGNCNGGEVMMPKPKRKRKPQKPGLTAKNYERHFVQVNIYNTMIIFVCCECPIGNRSPTYSHHVFVL